MTRPSTAMLIRIAKVLRPIVLLSLAISSCHTSSTKADPGPAPPLQRQANHLVVPEGSPLRERLKVEPVRVQEVRRELLAPAAVEAEPTRLAKIAPPLTGRVVKLSVKFGDTVKQGDPLFTLDSPDLVAAQSDYLKAKSALAQSDKNVARQRDLKEHGIGAQRELEQAETDRSTAESELERAQTRLRLLGSGPGSVGGPLTVKSPIAGRVIDLATAPGQFQNDPAAVLMIVADLSTVWVTANVQEKDLRRVQQGDDAVATFGAFPGETFNGKVLFVGDLLDPDTRTIKVRVSFDNADFRLKPGMFATMSFRGKAAPEIVVPTTAVVITGDTSSVFVEGAPWVFEKHDVETGEQIGDVVAVLKGLSVGQRVVVSNAVLLQ
jgi:cobalt-zinc-cadmium efflux system membrane fusion protein